MTSSGGDLEGGGWRAGSWRLDGYLPGVICGWTVIEEIRDRTGGI
jgi:hypothetical protein